MDGCGWFLYAGTENLEEEEEGWEEDDVWVMVGF